MNRIFLILVLAFSSLSAQAQLRKCVGADGKVTYSDVFCTKNSVEGVVQNRVSVLDSSGLRQEADRLSDKEVSRHEGEDPGIGNFGHNGWTQWHLAEEQNRATRRAQNMQIRALKQEAYANGSPPSKSDLSEKASTLGPDPGIGNFGHNGWVSAHLAEETMILEWRGQAIGMQMRVAESAVKSNINSQGYQTRDRFGNIVNSSENYPTSDSLGNRVNSQENFQTKDRYGNLVNSQSCYKSKDGFGNLVDSAACKQ
jgi:hypothetical protein